MEMLAAIQVLHTRSCSGMGTYFMRFLAACYLCFNMDYNTVLMALASLPPIMPARRMPSGERPQLRNSQVEDPSSMLQAGSMHIEPVCSGQGLVCALLEDSLEAVQHYFAPESP